MIVDHKEIHFFPSLKFTIFLSSWSYTVLSTLLIQAVCRTRVTTNSVNMPSLATSLPVGSVVRAPDRCTGSHGFRFRWFLCPTLVTNWIFHLSQEIPSLGKQQIFSLRERKLQDNSFLKKKNAKEIMINHEGARIWLKEFRRTTNKNICSSSWI